jgi:hypothetical protein
MVAFIEPLLARRKARQFFSSHNTNIRPLAKLAEWKFCRKSQEPGFRAVLAPLSIQARQFRNTPLDKWYFFGIIEGTGGLCMPRRGDMLIGTISRRLQR